MREETGTGLRSALGFALPLVLLGFVLVVVLAITLISLFTFKNQQPQPSEQLLLPTLPATPPRTTGTESELPRVKVFVDTAEIRLLESLPPQIQLLIRRNLPNKCEYQLVASQSRKGQDVRVTLEGLRPPESTCGFGIQHVVHTLRLEGGFEPGLYNLKINNYQVSFSVDE